MSQTTHELDVVIIGAGAAGLTTAYKLQQANPSINLVLLEAKDRVGGRVFSKFLPTADGEDEWDMGGQWVSRNHTYILDLIKDMEMETYPQYTEGSKKIIIDDYSDIRTYSGLFANLGIGNLIDANKIITKIESLSKLVSVENPLQNKHAFEWDSQTVESFVKKESSFATTKKLFDVIMKCVFGADSAHISMFFLIYYSALAGGFNVLLDTSDGGAQEYRVKGSMFGVFKKLVKTVGEEKVKFGGPVVSIQQTDKSSVLVSTLNGEKYRAKYVVCAIPPHLVNKIHFNPPLPFNRQQLDQRMPMGNLMKIFTIYKRAFWRDNNLTGESVMLLRQHDEGPICATFDVTTSKGSPALLGFVGGEQAFYWAQKPEEERKKEALKYFVSVFGQEAETELVTYHDYDWTKVDYNGGCPVGVMQPGCAVYFEHALREPYNRVHFAGTETARRWMGYIDGAVESGTRAANEIGERMKSPDKEVSSDIASPSPIFVKKSPKNDDCSIL